MKKQTKTILMAAVLSFSAFSITFGVWANEVTPEQLESAKGKARSLIERVIPVDQNIQDMRRVPNLPTPEEQGMKIHTENAQDPFAVAERVRKSTDNLVFDPNDAQGADLMVFVSFSMPEASLNRLAMETSKVGGVLVLRGFVEDSLKKTMAASEKMTNLGGKLQINPQLFQEYDVKRVPAYVIAKRTDGTSSCEGGTQCIDRLKLDGDASLHSVLERMSRDKNKSMSDVASAKLAQLEGR